MFRPADVPGSGGQRLLVCNGGTTKTWSAPDLAVHILGPATAGIGGTLTYQIDLANPGDLAAKQVTAALDVPAGLAYLGGNPAAEVAGSQLRWRIGDLGARQRLPIQLAFRAEKPGPAVVCCEATAAGGLKARECATTTVALAAAPPPSGPSPTGPSPTGSPAAPVTPLAVSLAPAQTAATVGGEVKFIISVSNNGATTITGGHIRVRFSPELAYEKAGGKDLIEHLLPALRAGETRQLALTIRVVKAGQASLGVEVTGPGIPSASAQAVVTAVGGRSPAAPAPATLSVTLTGPDKPAAVGDTVQFTIAVKNTGTTVVQNVQVAGRCDSVLKPDNATVGFRVVDKSLVWNIDSLGVGKEVRFAIECKCLAAAAKATTSFTVSLPDGSQATREASVEILQPEKPKSPPAPPPTPASPPKATGGGLSLSAASLTNPARPGSQLTYEIRLTNKENVTYHQVVVTAKVPEGMTPVALGTVGATIDYPSQTIRFNPVAELPPDKTQTYQVRVLAKQPGTYHLHVEMATPDLPKPMAVDSDETAVSK